MWLSSAISANSFRRLSPRLSSRPNLSWMSSPRDHRGLSKKPVKISPSMNPVADSRLLSSALVVLSDEWTRPKMPLALSKCRSNTVPSIFSPRSSQEAPTTPRSAAAFPTR